MKIFIKKFNDETLYGFADEAQRNEDTPRKDERMAGVSARKVKQWRKIIADFVALQNELSEMYENKVNQS